MRSQSQQLASYLQRFSDHQQIYLIGPLLTESQRNSWVEPVIFVDGGARFRSQSHGLRVCDGDSWSGELDVLLPQAKDFSDFSFALQNLPSQFAKIYIYGFLGGRRDHEMAVLGETHHFLNHRPSKTQCFLDTSILALSAGDWSIPISGLFSLFCLQETGVKLNGPILYPLVQKAKIPALSSLGLSNEASGIVQIQCEGPLFLFMTQDFKES